MMTRDSAIVPAFEFIVETAKANNLNNQLPSEACIVFTGILDWIDLEVPGGAHGGTIGDVIDRTRETLASIPLRTMYSMMRAEALREAWDDEVQEQFAECLAMDKDYAITLKSIFPHGLPHEIDLAVEKRYLSEAVVERQRLRREIKPHVREY